VSGIHLTYHINCKYNKLCFLWWCKFSLLWQTHPVNHNTNCKHIDYRWMDRQIHNKSYFFSLLYVTSFANFTSLYWAESSMLSPSYDSSKATLTADWLTRVTIPEAIVSLPHSPFERLSPAISPTDGNGRQQV